MIRYSIIGACGILFATSPAVAQQTRTPAPATQAQRAPPARPVTRAQFIADMDAQFKSLDGNSDGIATRLEIETVQRRNATAVAAQRSRQIFAQLDKDRNGQLSAAEFAALAVTPPSPNAGPLLAGWDGNKDGRVALIEFRAATQANFDRMDTDKDGVVSVAEMKAGGIIK